MLNNNTSKLKIVTITDGTKKKEIATMFSSLMKVLKKKERKVFCYIYMSSSVGS